ncbi:hypothetical protein B1748_20090 [Paenibacillus sp. MY03]|uniref:hypothetical protein n=1 Tax=Paenibacillus sp. MY03 TaxID=302980 RepID=UPI000B3C3219|nr:hypothetical protein [Paenibacillus sp. MY03]OUS74881.1 hypothetical protein B1748_20090 [Paenibacillus sp. MY03]
MNLIIRNASILIIATATLLGGLFNPPYVEPAAESAVVPSVEILRAGDGAVPIEHAQLGALDFSQKTSIERNGQVYVPIREYVEKHSGQLFYNRETASADITIGAVSFSLLFEEGSIMYNGHVLEGGVFVQDDLAYINAEQLAVMMNGQLAFSPA